MKKKELSYLFWKAKNTIIPFVTNTELSSEEVVEYYEKLGNYDNYIKEAKYDMAIGHLLLKSFWSNEAIFQFKMDFTKEMEYR
jgi:hypothetical protein